MDKVAAGTNAGCQENDLLGGILVASGETGDEVGVGVMRVEDVKQGEEDWVTDAS